MENGYRSEEEGSKPPQLNRACVNCAKAKSKCIFDSDSSNICQRCQRLQKQCEHTTPRARAPPKKRRAVHDSSDPSRPRVEKIEEKLDGLIDLLRTSRQSVAIDSPSQTKDGGRQWAEDSLEPIATWANRTSTRSHSHNFGLVQLGNQSMDGISMVTPDPSRAESQISGSTDAEKYAQCSNPPHASPKASTNLLNEFRDDEAERFLKIFNEETSLWFPFILVRGSSLTYLRQERPFLLSSILISLCRNAHRQRILGTGLMNQLMERIHINYERTMDLLLACIHYTEWALYQSFGNLPRLTSMMGTMNVVLCDLGLNRSLTNEPPNVYESAIRDICGRKPPVFRLRTSEEKRAFMGCFYLNSIVSAQFHRTDPLPSSPYLEQCTLDLSSETSLADRFSDGLIRLQLIAERIHQAPWNISTTLGIACPVTLFVKSVQDQLEIFKAGLAPDISQHTPMLLSTYSVEVHLYKVGLWSQTSTSPSIIIHDFERTELLCACQRALRNFFDLFLSIQSSEYRNLTLSIFTQLAHNFITAARLAGFEHPSWNPTYAQEALNMDTIISVIATNFESAPTVVGAGNEDGDRYSLYTKKLRLLQEFYKTKIVGSKSTDLSLGVNPSTELTLSSDDLLDEIWFRDVLAPWDNYAYE